MKTFSPDHPTRPDQATDPRVRAISDQGSESHTPVNPPAALVSPDLAAVGEELVPEFPLGAVGTDLVLYGGPPGELKAHWFLDRNDFAKAAASFADQGHRAVIRLHRESASGGAQLLDERTLIDRRRDGSGEAVFRVPPDHGRYRAELGVSNANGGWLMLARSNSLNNAVPVGLRLPVRHLPEAGSVSASEPASKMDGSDRPLIPQGAVHHGPRTESASGFGIFVESADGALGVEAGAVGGEVGPDQRCWQPQCVRALPLGADLVDSPVVGGSIQRLLQGGGGSAEPQRVHRGPGPAAFSDLGSADGGVRSSQGCLPVPVLVGAEIPQLTYQQGPMWANGAELEAELRISGRAPPNSVIDLFGFPYRVGPGGRFQFLVRVEDADLLRRALQAAPAPPSDRPPDLYRG